VVRGEDTAGALLLGEVGNQGTTIATSHALVAETGVRPGGLGRSTDCHAEALDIYHEIKTCHGQKDRSDKNLQAGMP